MIQLQLGVARPLAEARHLLNESMFLSEPHENATVQHMSDVSGTTNNEMLKKTIIDFVCAQIGQNNRGRISSATTLRNDLGLDGRDAVEFMVEFSRHFTVDMSGFEIDEHFAPEGIIRSSLHAFLKNRDYVPITIDMLVNAAKTKIWLSVRHPESD